MSGREPVAAFFPSIDRNLLAELDRHLRTPVAPEPAEAEPYRSEPSGSEPCEAATPPPAAEIVCAPTGRPDIADVVEAVEQAAYSLAAMDARIRELDQQVASLQSANRDLGAQADESRQLQEAAEARALAHDKRAEEAQRIAAHHGARADVLERDLATALADLTRVTDAIANTLGLPAAT